MGEPKRREHLPAISPLPTLQKWSLSPSVSLPQTLGRRRPDMADTPQKPNPRSKSKPLPSPPPSTPIPLTSQPNTPRRSLRRLSLPVDPHFLTPQKPVIQGSRHTNDCLNQPKSSRKPKRSLLGAGNLPPPSSPSIAPASPDLPEPKKRGRPPRLTEESSPTDAKTRGRPRLLEESSPALRVSVKRWGRPRTSEESSLVSRRGAKKRVYYKKVVYDGGVFDVGDYVYVKRREGAESDDEPEVEDCRICFQTGKSVMLECDECLAGFHLKCLKPPLKEVPEGDWVCGFCEVRKMGKVVELPKPPAGKKLRRTAKEKLLSSDLWAAHIESLWKEPDEVYWAKVCWYIIPEETAAGRQPHNLKRELYRTNDFADIEMESILRQCHVMNPKEFSKANNDGDDVFLCEYEYDIHWHSFKRIADADGHEENEEVGNVKDWDSSNDYFSDSEADSEYEKEQLSDSPAHKYRKQGFAANLHKGRIYGLQRIGAKKIPKHVRCRKQTELERAKATLLLATLPKTLPCRNKEMVEITAFVKGAISEDQCLGRCLYIHGVPGTGKTMSVLAVMRNLRSEVDAGSLRPYCLVEINCLKLSSPENIYKVIYEALSGHRVGWKKALHLLNERFSESSNTRKDDSQPCVILIDELDLLVTKNQSVLYNILDWPTRLNSKLIIIGIANTMDLPEKLLPRISSRMGIQRLCFGPYNYQQLQEIISSRLNGIDAFDKQAVEFASRKVAAISGDARRALEVCRRAAELADYRVKQSPSEVALRSATDSASGRYLVDMADVEAAIKEMFQVPHIQVMKTCSRLSKIVLTAMVHELYRTGMAEVTFEKLAMTTSSMCSGNGEAFPGWDTLLKVSCKLGECKIILCEEAFRHRIQKLQLNFPSDDVAFALKNCPEVPWLAKYL